MKTENLRITNSELRIKFVIHNSLFAICHLLFAILLPGCSSTPRPDASGVAPITLETVFEDFEPIPGWSPMDETRIYDSETIFELVNGQADAFFAYNFEHVGVRSYRNADETVLRVEIWQLATTTDAYGLFTRNRAGAPVAVGNEGDGDPGRRVAFWQDRYYVQVRTRQQLPDTELHTFAQSVAAALPKGGTRPSLIDRLPADGLVANSAIFFRLEISIQDEVWLGGENVLALNEETEGILATYEIEGNSVHVLLIQYPDADAASEGARALKETPPDSLVVSDAHNNFLGIVFGELNTSAASVLLAKVLQ